MADYWSNFVPRQRECSLFNALVDGEPYSGWKNLLLYRKVQNIFRYLKPFRSDLQMWQTTRQTDGRTDGRTDRLADSICRAIRCVTRNKGARILQSLFSDSGSGGVEIELKSLKIYSEKTVKCTTHLPSFVLLHTPLVVKNKIK